jgi:mRNA-degrading endonuclease YafQ of YafQ-DinJ toxin-antitoxin module
VYALKATERFLRQAGKFFRKHPDVKARFTEVTEALTKDPFQPTLELHGLKGKLRGLYAVSLTHAYRVTLTLKVKRKEIILIDIGGHDEVY